MKRLFIIESKNACGTDWKERFLVNRANLRITELKLSRGEPLKIKPTLFEDLLEFFFVLKGAIEIESEGIKVKLTEGEYFYTHDLRRAVLVSSPSDALILVASNISITKQVNPSVIDDTKQKVTAGGLYIMGKGCINRATQDNNALSLLASGGGLDVMLQEIFGRRPGCVTPGDSPDLLEFFYILEGEFILNDNGNEHVLNAGDAFYVYDLDHTISFTAEDGARAIYVASKPIFDYLLDFMEDLNELLRQYEQKDIYTHNHSIRVEQYTLKIASRMGLPNDKLLAIAVASLFHDIGKVNIPDEVLNKVGMLNDRDFEYIRKHPSDSAKVLSQRFEEALTDIVGQHHERLDGSGYPLGLKGDEIMLEAKIVAVADSYDAMTSDRAYRKGITPQTAIDELKELAGTLYDPDAVNTLEKILKEEGHIASTG